MQNDYGKEKEGAARVGDYINQGEDKFKVIAAEAQKKLKETQEQVAQLASTLDKQVKENPWPAIAGVAVGCLFLGFIMGKSKH
jgi:ElaB/YqjD/DUF883 family membrane-anchored ribosome-binding protein